MIKLINAKGATRILPETMIFKNVPLDFKVPMQSLVGMDGAVKTGKTTLSSRQFVISGRIYYPGDKDRIVQELDGLLLFLRYAPIRVYRDKSHDRFLFAYPLGAQQDWIDKGIELALNIPMLALDPYWYGAEILEEVSGTKTIEVDGNALVAPYVKTKSSVSSLTLINNTTGDEIAVTGSGIIEVDNEEFTCFINGNNRLDAVNSEWLLTGFNLQPGSNSITTNVPVELTYRPRWY
ncbi:MAG TPA: hypothetical protein GX519_08215 [Thermoanaerobacterales bacterium]|nr:hypothetical protein [Thermoanaerobacterales bacterium]